MATTISTLKQYEKYNSADNLPLDKIFFEKSGVYYKASELYIAVGSSPYKKVKTWADCAANISNLSISPSVNSPVAPQAYSRTYERPPYATEIDATSGASKFLKRTAIESFADPVIGTKYVLITLQGHANPQFVKLSDISYYAGITETSINGKSVADLTGKELFYKGQHIKTLFTDTQFAFENYKFKINVGGVDKEIDAVTEEFNPATLEKTTYTITFGADGAPELDGDGNVKYTATTKKVDSSRTIHDYETKKVDGENGKTEDVSMVAIRNYNYDTNGEFIAVKLNGKNTVTIVKIADLKKLDGTGLPSDPADPTKPDLNAMLGKSVKVTVNGTEYTTEPLTLEQITVKYNSTKHYEASLSSEDVLTDNAHLMLKNGKFVKEKDVAKQIYYKTLGAATDATITNYDVYVANVVDKSGAAKQIVLNKDYFETKAIGKSSPFTLDGYTIDMANVKKAKRVAYYVDCDVVQTTSQGKDIESCKIYTDTATRDTEKAANQEDFEKSYKAGQYQLSTAYVYDAATGKYELQELDDRDKRYLYSDVHYAECHSDNKTEYVALVEKPYSYEYKDGELKITDGPSYDIGKGIANGFKVWGKSLGYGMAAMCMSGGIMVALAAPVLVAAGIAAAAVAPIAIPIANAVYGTAKNTFNRRKWTQPENYNEEQWRKEITKQLETFKTDTLTQTNTDENKLKFQNACDNIDSMVTELLEAHVHEGFVFKDGKVEINKHNVHAVAKFMDEVEFEHSVLKGEDNIKGKRKRQYKRKRKELQTKLAQLKEKPFDTLTPEEQQELAKIEKYFDCEKYMQLKDKDASKFTPDELAEFERVKTVYENFQLEFEEKMTYYESEPFKSIPADESKALVENAQTLKAFLYLKQFTADTDVTFTIDGGTVTIDRTVLKDLDYDFVKNVFIYNKKEYALDSLTDPNLLAIKQALTSTEISTAIAKEPEKTNTDYPLEEKLEELQSLCEECKTLSTEITATILAGLDPSIYAIVLDLANKTTQANNDAQAEIVDFETFKMDIKSTDLDAKIATVTAKKSDLETTKPNAVNAADKIMQIIDAYNKFNNKLPAVNGKLLDRDKALLDAEKAMFTMFAGEYSIYADDALAAAKATTTEADLQLSLDTINNQMQNLDQLLLKIDELAVTNSKKQVVDKLKQSYLAVRDAINSTNPPIAETTMFVNKLRHVEDIIKDLKTETVKPETSLADARKLTFKADKLQQLVEVSVKVVEVVKYLKEKSSSAATIAHVGSIVGKIDSLINVSASTTVDDLITMIREVRGIYERELKPYLRHTSSKTLDIPALLAIVGSICPTTAKGRNAFMALAEYYIDKKSRSETIEPGVEDALRNNKNYLSDNFADIPARKKSKAAFINNQLIPYLGNDKIVYEITEAFRIESA